MTDDGVCEVASPLDIFATKIKVRLQRVESKDYRDIAALLRTGISLEKALGAASTLYGGTFQPAESLKALTYFEGGDLEALSEDERAFLIAHAARAKSAEIVPLASNRLSLQPKR